MLIQSLFLIAKQETKAMAIQALPLKVKSLKTNMETKILTLRVGTNHDEKEQHSLANNS